MIDDRIQCLENKKLGVYTLALHIKAKQIQGHFDLSVHLRNKKGIQSNGPCIRGLYSKGRKDASYHFFDAIFSPVVHFKNEWINLIDENLADKLFKLIGIIIRPGGQLYLSYLNDEQFFRSTNNAFIKGIPPIATVLGRFVFLSGCIHVKSFYGAEGRFRIEGEKPKDTETALKWTHEMLDEMITYLMRN